MRSREHRPYQATLTVEARQAVMRSGSCVIVLATGGGKTVVAADIAERAAVKGNQTLLLVHRRELVRQAIETLELAMPHLFIGVEAPGFVSMPGVPLQVASVQTLARREGLTMNPAIVIVDECHHARAKTWEKVLAMFPSAKIIGLTATPERLDGKGLYEHFKEMVLGPTIPELVELKALAPTRTLTIPTGLRPDRMRRDRHGNVRESDQREQVTEKVVADAADAYQRYCRGKRAIFFGVHRQHSKDVAYSLRQRGVRAEHIDATDTTHRRDRIMGLLKNGGIDVVCNVDLISEGFDAPGCEAVLLGGFTTSVTQFLQRSGRAMRYDSAQPDKVALVCDLAGICAELGLPDEEREWSLLDGEINSGRKKPKKPTCCDECLTVFYGAKCPHCNNVMPLPLTVQTASTELVEAKAKGPKTTKDQRRVVFRDALQAETDEEAEKIMAGFNRRVGYHRNYGMKWVMGERAKRNWKSATRYG